MFDWKLYLELARELNGRPSGDWLYEAALRSAVSRAYYAVFCALREYAMQWLGFAPTRTGADHLDLSSFLQQQGGDWEEVADMLDELRRWRNLCDYNNRVRRLATLTAEAIRTADDIFAVLNR